MRTQKRFEFRLCSDELYYFYIIDNETGKEYRYLIDDELLKLLNELSEKKDYFERKWRIANAENIQLRQENKELKKRMSS